jgi:hypothetical protein
LIATKLSTTKEEEYNATAGPKIWSIFSWRPPTWQSTLDDAASMNHCPRSHDYIYACPISIPYKYRTREVLIA